MTGIDDMAQWLLGGGGEVLRFVLYVIVAWLLIGALPRMRRDAAEKVPQVRGTARTRMRHYAKKSKGRGRSPEWWGWTAAWGVISVAAEGARFGGYVVTSAWRGWGDHRRRVKALRETPPWRKTDSEPAPGPDTPPEPAAPPPPDGGRPGTAPAGPPQATVPDPAPEPPRPDEPPQPAEPPPGVPGLEPAGAGPGPDADVIPFTPRGSAGSDNEGEKPVAAEISDLEAAERVVAEMQRRAQQELDAATAERSNAQKALRDAEQAANDLAAAGVKGPVMEAFTNYYEAMERAEAAAISKAVAAEAALAAANAARGALMAHRDAADRLAATGGAADSTRWYGATG